MSPQKAAVTCDAAFKSPLLSQAIVHNGTVYVSGNVGLDPQTMKLVEGSVGDRTRQALHLMRMVLEEAGSSLENVVKCNIFITTMKDYAEMNKIYDEIMPSPKAARTCVAVAELPMGADVEIECIAHL